MSDDNEKQFEATPHKREEARKQGRFARSKDAGSLAAAAAVLATVLGSLGAFQAGLRTVLGLCLGDPGALSRPDGFASLQRVGGVLLAMSAPPVIAAAVASTAVSLAQSGVRIQFDLVAFKPERLDPLPRLKDLFSFKHGSAEVLLGLARVAVVAWTTWRVVALDLAALMSLARAPLESAGPAAARVLVRVLGAGVLALGVVSALDYAWSWWRLEQDLKMSRKELMDETKAQEGDPKLKGKMKQRARQMLRKRNLANVQKADVVVTNPTHVAVALRYGAKDPAPVVVAKGHDDLALLIRAVARRKGIPVVENRALARALDAAVALGAPVPQKHFLAVAKVLAYVYRLKGRRSTTAPAARSARR